MEAIMSTDNVTPIRGAGTGDTKPPRRQRKSGPHEQKAEIAFGGIGEGPDTLTIWQGLRGVCRELQLIQASIDSESIDRYGELGAAAEVLAGLLEARLMVGINV
jgi:hypothetical protein